MPLPRFIKNVEEFAIEDIFAVVAALLVLVTAKMGLYVSFGIAVILLAAIGLYVFARRYRQVQRCLNS